MLRKIFYSISFLGLAGNSFAQQALRINEAVVDPQQDWNNSGTISPSDEWFEILNSGSAPFNLYGIELHLIDTTPNAISLSNFGILAPGQRIVVLDPEGMQNNNGRLSLFDVINQIEIEGWSYGSWPGNIYNVPDGNSRGPYDESISRFPESSNSFFKTFATYNAANVPEASVLALGGLAGLLAGRRRRR